MNENMAGLVDTRSVASKVTLAQANKRMHYFHVFISNI